VAWIAIFLGHVQPFRQITPADTGMFIFFALSGFLITQLIVAEHEKYGKVRLGRFLKRRVVRLLPSLAVFVGIWFLAVCLFMGDSWLTTVPQGGPGQFIGFKTAIEGVLATFSYFMNWVEIFHWFSGYVPIGHIWSLAVEMQFYIIWAAMLVFLLRFGRRVALWAAVIGSLAASVEAIWLMHGGHNGLRVYMGTDVRAGALLAGSAAAILWTYARFDFNRSKFFSVAAVVSVGVVIWSAFAFTKPTFSLSQQLAWPLTAVACAIVVLFMVEKADSVFGRWAARPVITYIGKRSYALYLWHYLWLTWFRSLGFLGVIAALMMSLISAELSWRLVENPVTAWSKRATRNAETGIATIETQPVELVHG
jgi:peptidoglycan/LPS O-acetylase OafA/YrhL